MFKLFIDYDKAVDICLSPESEPVWYKIICLQTESGVGLNRPQDDSFYSEDNPLFLVSQSEGIEFKDESVLMDSIPENHSAVLTSPCGAFILPIPKEEAAEIQSGYGVICQSVDSMNTNILTLSDIEIDGPNQNGDTWGRIPLGGVIPTNSLIIQDRYFFRSDHGENVQDIYYNFKEIIRNLLPLSLSATFHLMVIVDGEKIEQRDAVTFEEIAEKLNGITEQISKERGYSIVLEVLSIPESDRHNYPNTHNSRIISNYYTIKADHKIKAFRGTQCLADQTIASKLLYSKGVKDNLSDPPERRHRKWISNFRQMVKLSRDNYDYSRNGYYVNGPLVIENRILR